VALGVWLGACTSGRAQDTAHPILLSGALSGAAIPDVTVPPTASPARVRILVTGDVIPHRPQLFAPASLAASLAELAPMFESASATLVNYEASTLDPPEPAGKSSPFSLYATPDWMAALTHAHVTSLSVANNHACDLGTRGLERSVAAARTLEIPVLGGGTDPWKATTLASSGGKRVCAIGWTTFVNNPHASCAQSPELAIAKPTREGRLRVARAIADAYHDGCTAVLAVAHGGDEYAPQTEAMMTLARAAADAGADAVMLHHPHVVSPLVTYDTEDGRHVPIFASLGNLVSNQGESWTPAYPPAQADRHIVYLNGWTRVGMIAELDMRLDERRHVSAFGYHLVFVESDHVLDKANPHPRIVARTLDPDLDRAIIADLSRDAAGPRTVFDNPAWIENRGAQRSDSRDEGLRESR
jgi:poly-gamma-glutamate capsule biosynthesis protein CapA/YwtB (metallophosphatase superfamily)